MLSPPVLPHSVFRISTTAPATGSLVPRIVTIPSTVAVPGGSGCCCGCCTVWSVTNGNGHIARPKENIVAAAAFGGKRRSRKRRRTATSHLHENCGR